VIDFGDALIKARRDLMRHADERSRGLAAILRRVEARMLANIAEHGENGVTRAQANRVTSQLHRIALDAEPQVARWLRGELPAAALNGVRTQAALLVKSFGVKQWDEIPVSRVKEAFANFQKVIETGKILPLKDAALMERWGGLWNDRMANAMGGIQEKFIEGIARGQSWLDIAKSITSDVGGLDIVGEMAPEDWARGFTRAKMTEMAVAAGTRSATEAGITRFINIGVPDDRQSDECAAASSQEPMTLEEWDAFSEGPPPRHVFNCRCDLGGVPEFAQEEILAEMQLTEEAMA
jgi:hypothetical protein